MNEQIFGEISKDGSVIRDAQICAITGKPIETGDATVRIGQTNKFFRVSALAMPLLTAEKRKEIEKMANDDKAEPTNVGISVTPANNEVVFTPSSGELDAAKKGNK